MTECFRCGADDHLSRDCPNRTRGHLTPVPPAPEGATGKPPAVPPRVHVDPAIAEQWARAIRERLGWDLKENP